MVNIISVFLTNSSEAGGEIEGQFKAAIIAGELLDYGRAAGDPLVLAAAARILSRAKVMTLDATSESSLQVIMRDAASMAAMPPAKAFPPAEVRGIEGDAIYASTLSLAPGQVETYELNCRADEQMIASVRPMSNSDVSLSAIGLTVSGPDLHARGQRILDGLSVTWVPKQTDRYRVQIQNEASEGTLHVQYYVNVH